jgi:wingless-type MMTV integration site family protein 16
MISNQMTVKCRCHGVSGSCAVKSCWRRMPNFRQIGDALKHKYEHSVRISHNSRRQLRRKEKRKRREPVPENELVFIETSPDFCRADPGRGVVGTRGRLCNRYSPGPDGCGTLCCGRGFSRQVVRTTERCQCKFVWCCQVKCRTCETVTEKYFCK